MKSIFNSTNFKRFLFLPLVIFALMLSCQTEEVDIVNPPQEDVIQGDSQTASLMRKTVSNDGSIDNIIDQANCLEIALPVTVTANNVTITIENFTDYDALEDILDAFTNDADDVVITFPITIILNDHSEIVINNQAELEAKIEACNGENEMDDDIECIDFQYPIVFSIYNTNFQVLETVTIQKDEELYDFLQTLDGPVLAGLNFPVTMVLANGEKVEVNNNQELDEAITAAEDSCDEDDDYDWNDDDISNCERQEVKLALKECVWTIVAYNEDDNLIEYSFDFTESFDVFVYQNTNVVTEGNWTVSQNTNAPAILELNLNFEGLEGNWEIVECDNERFELVRNQDTIVMERDCETNTNPFECFESFDAVLEKCDNNNDGFEEFDLAVAFSNCTTPNFVVSYYETEADAQANANALSSTIYTNTTLEQFVYVRAEVAGDASIFRTFPIKLRVKDCGNTSFCTKGDVEGILSDCVWTITSYVGDESFNIFNIDFTIGGSLTITATNESYTGNWTVSQEGDFVYVKLTDISGGNVQVFNGINFKVVECTGAQMIFHDVTNTNNELVLDKDCN